MHGPGGGGPARGSSSGPSTAESLHVVFGRENDMTDNISITGLVATVPEHRRVRDNVEITSFRLASQQRYFDRNAKSWVDGETNWYTVSAYRHLARNVLESVHKGDRVVITGRLRIRRWENGEKKGNAVDIDADSVGQDLAWGTARYTRTPAKDAVPVSSEGPTAPTDNRGYSVGSNPTATDNGVDIERPDVGQAPVDWHVTQPGAAAGEDRYDTVVVAPEDNHEIPI